MRSRWIGLGVVTVLAAALLFSGCDLLDGLFGRMEITSVEPAQGISNDVVILTISGEHISPDDAPGLQARLVGVGTAVDANNINYLTDSRFTAEFNLSGVVPMEMDVYLKDDDGNEALLERAFTVMEYEVVQEALPSVAVIDVSVDDQAYDFSMKATCVIDSSARDITFTLNAGDPALTITGTGGLIRYVGGFPSLGQASDIEEDPSAYAGVGDPVLPFGLEAGQYYGAVDVSGIEQFVVIEIVGVDKDADTVTINYMIVRKILG